MQPNELFLSYSSLDHAFAKSIVDVLRHHAIPVWHSATSLVGGQLWHDEVGDALRRCDWFAVIISPHSVNSMWVKRELEFVLDERRLADKILPLLYQACDYKRFSWALSSSQMIDFTGDFHTACRAFLRTWGLGYKQP
jgi:hypothetical protein